MKRLDVMLDIETLSNRTDAHIIQIGAVAFDIESGEVLDEFCVDINPRLDWKKYGQNFDTILWWMDQKKEVRDSVFSCEDMNANVRNALMDLQVFIRNAANMNGIDYEDRKSVYLWGNGPAFDNALIKHACEVEGVPYVIRGYQNDICFRTIVDLAAAKLGITRRELKKRFPANDMAHNALADAIWQANVAAWCYGYLLELDMNGETQC